MKNLLFFITFCFFALVFFANFSFLTNIFIIYIIILLFQRKKINIIFILLSALFLDLLTFNPINYNFLFFSILVFLDYFLQKYIHYDSITCQILVGEFIILIYTLLKGILLFTRTNLISINLIYFFIYTSMVFIPLIYFLNKNIFKNE